MRKIYFLVFFTISLNILGQEYFHEDFNQGEIPSTWEIIQTNTVRTWQISLQQGNGTYLAVVSGDPSGGEEDEWLISPNVDLSDAVNPIFHFESNYSTYELVTIDIADFIVYASTDDGETWEQIWIDSDGYYDYDYGTQLALINLNISDYVGESNVKFAFRLQADLSNNFNGSVWLDSVNISENIAVESIEVSTEDGSEEMYVMSYKVLEAAVFPENATNSAFVWSVVEGQDILEVNTYGYAYSNNIPGTAVVRATSVENSDVYGEIEIEIVDPFVDDGCNQRFDGYENVDIFDITKIGTSVENLGANDFIVPAESEFVLESLAPILRPGNFTYYNPDEFNLFYVEIREDNNDMPGEIIAQYESLDDFSFFGVEVYRVNINLPEPIVLEGGENGTKYWITLTATSTNNYPIQWHGFPYETGGETSYSYISNDGGETWNPAQRTSGMFEFTLDLYGSCRSLGISKIDDNAWVLYPNPTSGVVTIEGEVDIKTVELYNTIGEKLNTQVNTRGEVDLTHLPQGIYIAKIKSKRGEVMTQKIIKK